jgi:hypothetical protein
VLARPQLRFTLAAITFVLTLFMRTRDISRHFWLLGDQIRDWAIALGPIGSLPLVGPPTHVHGYTIGPAFYWILWCIRVVVGPFFQNLPHSGGIGQAILQSGVDVLLLFAVWKRTQSVCLGLTTIALLATAPFDMALAAVVWNPVVGAILAKAATALILLDWHRGSLVRTGLTATIAWSAVHAYTGTIFVALSVFAALLADPLLRSEWPVLRRRALVIGGAVAALQLPYVIHQAVTRFGDSGMTAVSSSLTEMLAGRESPRLAASTISYIGALTSIQSVPGSTATWVSILLLCAAWVAVHYRRDATLLIILLLPQAGAILGYALWFGDLDSYYYLSLAPAAVLTVVFAMATVTPTRIGGAAAAVVLAGAIALMPARARTAATLFSMPEYRALVAGSRHIAGRGQPIQSIRTEFDLPPTSDPEFIFRVLGGRIDRWAPWAAVILADGRVEYIQRPPGGS